MKRRVLLFCLAALLCVAAVAVYKYRAAIFPGGEVSELYLRYADEEGVDATFIRGFQVNDTVSVDVTLLQATDSAGWARLQADFGVPPLAEEYLRRMTDENSITVRLVDVNVILGREAEGEDLKPAAISRTKRTVGVFHTRSPQQTDMIIDSYFENITIHKHNIY
jgi:hypothetical protein